ELLVDQAVEVHLPGEDVHLEVAVRDGGLRLLELAENGVVTDDDPNHVVIADFLAELVIAELDAIGHVLHDHQHQHEREDDKDDPTQDALGHPYRWSGRTLALAVVAILIWHSVVAPARRRRGAEGVDALESAT